jgi:hypothetical protein
MVLYGPTIDVSMETLSVVTPQILSFDKFRQDEPGEYLTILSILRQSLDCLHTCIQSCVLFYTSKSTPEKLPMQVDPSRQDR